MEFTTTQPLFWLLVLILLGVGFAVSLVDRPTSLKVGSILLRALAVVLLVFALCRPFVTKEGKNVHVVFLVDVSESVDLLAVEGAGERIQEAVSRLDALDSHSVFMIGKGVRKVESTAKLVETVKVWREGIADDEFRSASQLADSLLATRLAFPSGKARRVVLFSDGRKRRQMLRPRLKP